MHKSLRYKLWTGGVVAIAVFSIMYPFFVPPTPKTQQPDEAPQVDMQVPDFAAISSINEKKQAFFQFILPEVEKQNALILNQRSFILAFRDRFRRQQQGQQFLDSIDMRKLRAIAKQYDVKVTEVNEELFRKLLKKVDFIPKELVLVQAANESAWGTSRFARLGNNYFGMWCFQKGCGFVPKRRSADMSHEVAKYDSLEQGVAKYLNTLNRHYAYSDLRYIRAVLRETQQPITGELLAEGLIHYSERGQAYVDELQAMIRVNRKFM